MELVFIKDEEKELTTSLKVAKKFGKNHKDVLRDVDRLDCSVEFKVKNYEETSYVDVKGRKQKMYEMTVGGWNSGNSNKSTLSKFNEGGR